MPEKISVAIVRFWTSPKLSMKTRRSLFHFSSSGRARQRVREHEESGVEKKDGRLDVVLSLADL